MQLAIDSLATSATLNPFSVRRPPAESRKRAPSSGLGARRMKG
jgi:hypothetical protein